jgi:cation diffusion facilitator family transporter
MNPGSRRAIFAALAANMGITVLKFIGWTVTGATSMLAEAVHSIADSGNQALLLWGAAAADKAPDATHSFGYGRERYFWSFVVALILFTLGGLFAIVEGIERIGHPEPVARPEIAMAILVAGMLIEGLSLRTAIRESRVAKAGTSWWNFIRRTKSPELPVILLEDLGAMCGLTIALVGVALSAMTGNSVFDGWASISIGVLLCGLAAILAVEMKSLLIGESVNPVDDEAIRRAIEASPKVNRVIHMRTQHFGPDEILVGIKVEFASNVGFEELATAIDDAEARVREKLPDQEVMIYLEPDVFKPERLSPRDSPSKDGN